MTSIGIGDPSVLNKAQHNFRDFTYLTNQFLDELITNNRKSKMNQDYILADSWNIIEEGFNPKHVESSESIFSLGNGAMGQRANFEERYSGRTFKELQQVFTIQTKQK